MDVRMALAAGYMRKGRTRARVMAYLETAPAATPSEVAKALGISAGSALAALRRIKAAGPVTRDSLVPMERLLASLMDGRTHTAPELRAASGLDNVPVYVNRLRRRGFDILTIFTRRGAPTTYCLVGGGQR